MTSVKELRDKTTQFLSESPLHCSRSHWALSWFSSV